MAADTGVALRAVGSLDVGGILVRRWLGCWIDLFVAAALTLVAITPWLGTDVVTNGQVLGCFLLALVLVVGYFTLAEGLTGRTLGKLLTGTVVIDANGGHPGVRRAFTRTLLRLIETNPLLLGGVPAGLAVALSQNKQRLGDLAAGTFVVPLKALETARVMAGSADLFD
jgi:uncharacterized RDD family membrane protein YckC